MNYSQRTVRQLHARGFTDSEIGRALGRDSSLVRQIRTGKKKGANLEGSLREIMRGTPGRRGRPLKTAPAEYVPGRKRRAGGVVTPTGARYFTFSPRNRASYLKTLAMAAARGLVVYIDARFGAVKWYARRKPVADSVVDLLEGQELDPGKLIDAGDTWGPIYATVLADHRIEAVGSSPEGAAEMDADKPRGLLEVRVNVSEGLHVDDYEGPSDYDDEEDIEF